MFSFREKKKGANQTSRKEVLIDDQSDDERCELTVMVESNRVHLLVVMEENKWQTNANLDEENTMMNPKSVDDVP